MSKEHIIGDWVKSVIPRKSGEHTHRWAQRRKKDGKIEVERPRVVTRQGDLGTRQLRRVCVQCNKGWMKDIQDASIPILAPLFRGVWGELGRPEASQIALWATMTIMSFDAAERTGGGVSQTERRILCENGLIPPNWRLWMGRRTGGDGMHVRHIPLRFWSTAVASTDNDERSQVTTIELGQLVLHGLTIPTRVHQFDPFRYGLRFGVIPIHPGWGGLADWRYAPFLDGEAVSKLSDTFADRLVDQSRST